MAGMSFTVRWFQPHTYGASARRCVVLPMITACPLLMNSFSVMQEAGSLRERCVVGSVLSQIEGELSPEDDATLRCAANSAWGGGLDTVRCLSSFWSDVWSFDGTHDAESVYHPYVLPCHAAQPARASQGSSRD